MENKKYHKLSKKVRRQSSLEEKKQKGPQSSSLFTGQNKGVFQELSNQKIFNDKDYKKLILYDQIYINSNFVKSKIPKIDKYIKVFIKNCLKKDRNLKNLIVKTKRQIDGRKNIIKERNLSNGCAKIKQKENLKQEEREENVRTQFRTNIEETKEQEKEELTRD